MVPTDLWSRVIFLKYAKGKYLKSMLQYCTLSHDTLVWISYSWSCWSAVLEISEQYLACVWPREDHKRNVNEDFDMCQ